MLLLAVLLSNCDYICNMKLALRTFIFSIFCLLPYLGEAQCAMCKASAKSSSSFGSLIALNNGILYLIAVVYILFTIGYFVFLKGKVGKFFKEIKNLP